MIEQLNQAIRNVLPMEAKLDVLANDDKEITWSVIYKGKWARLYALLEAIGDDIDDACEMIAREATHLIKELDELETDR